MQVFKEYNYEELPKLLKRPFLNYTEVEKIIIPIFEKVQEEGDEALYELTEKFDRVRPDSLLVTREEVEESKILLDKDLIKSIHTAKENIEKYHQSQVQDQGMVETSSEVFCWSKYVPIEKVGLYVPGGTAPLFSTALMLGIPAKIANCKEICFVTPPMKNGKIHPATLYAMNLAGADKIIKVGGAQAIAALIFGTETISGVHKIFGPGNQFVTAAKQLAQKYGVAVDLPAGPSEVAVLADKSANPTFLAADLLSQAEHGEDSQVILVSDNLNIIIKTLEQINLQIKKLPRGQIARTSLESSKAFLVQNLDEGMDILNQYAPEHLILQVENPKIIAEKVVNAGSVFLGQYTPESAGDYASGTNHVLPTGGWAASISGLNLSNFQKRISFQEISLTGLQKLGPTIEKLAEAEGLDAHKQAVTLRLLHGKS